MLLAFLFFSNIHFCCFYEIADFRKLFKSIFMFHAYSPSKGVRENWQSFVYDVVNMHRHYYVCVKMRRIKVCILLMKTLCIYLI